MSNNRDNRNNDKPFNRRGPARRTYGQGSGPRVGSIARDVPRAEKVSGEGDFQAPRERYVPRNSRGGQNGRYDRAERNDSRQPSRYSTGGYDRGDRVPREEQRGGFKANPRRRDDPAQRIRTQEDFNREEGFAERREASHDGERRPHHGAAWRSESGPARPRDELSEPDAERVLVGRNPVREALRAGRPVEKLLIAQGDLSGAAREIIKLAKDAGVIVQQVDRSRLDQIAPNHQGMLAYVAAVPYVELGDILEAAKAKGEDPFVILLDGVTDPHNLGAIIRSAECAGAHGVVIPERRASGLTPVVAKAAAGALSHMPVARVTNLNRAIEALKEAGVWVLGTAMNGENALTADLTGPVALVIGSEGEGISHLTLEKCDRTLSLPMMGRIESLNASVAAGILMYEIVRARAK